MRLIDAEYLLFNLANESFPQSVPYGQGRNSVIESIKNAPAIDAVPVRHEDDGTLWVTVGDCEKVGRVIVKNEQGHFCRVFYMGDGDEEPVRHGRWEINTDLTMHCSCCGELFRFDDKDECLDFMEYAKYCIACGAKMDEGEDNED